MLRRRTGFVTDKLPKPKTRGFARRGARSQRAGGRRASALQSLSPASEEEITPRGFHGRNSEIGLQTVAEFQIGDEARMLVLLRGCRRSGIAGDA